ncbi:MAG TPA: thymidine phosphorylase [Candidatus Eremiobacteraceae bacterium]|nr:thymidine phosphorylase [Candidatus Eremiobacteraceae bacterium]
MADAKAAGGEHTPADIAALVRAYVSDEIGDDAMTEWLRAVCARGMTLRETIALTQAMADSGERIAWSAADGNVVDKHSTGGVGDAVSLVAVPLAAACGVRVAKLSGRALGHTGGTLDKLECVPGTRVGLTIPEFRDQVRRVGCAIAAASERLAPADRKMYALRHRTDTVASIPLIAASVMSKKIAAGAPAIVLDVKVGNGAFFRDVDEGRELARTMTQIGAAMGRRMRVLLTSMDEPLADAAGDALELDQALLVLEGGGGARLREASRLIAAALLEAGGAAESEEAMVRVDEALRDGAARSKFSEMLGAQGGRLDRFDRTFAEGYAVGAQASGVVGRINTRAVGEIVAEAKSRAPSHASPRIGVRFMRRPGDEVREGEPIMRFIAAEPDAGIVRLLEQTYQVGTTPPKRQPLVLGVVQSDGAAELKTAGFDVR